MTFAESNPPSNPSFWKTLFGSGGLSLGLVFVFLIGCEFISRTANHLGFLSVLVWTLLGAFGFVHLVQHISQKSNHLKKADQIKLWSFLSVTMILAIFYTSWVAIIGKHLLNIETTTILAWAPYFKRAYTVFLFIALISIISNLFFKEHWSIHRVLERGILFSIGGIFFLDVAKNYFL